MDLRERVLQAIDDGLSKSAAHRLFRISRSTIDHWFRSLVCPARADQQFGAASGACHAWPATARRGFSWWLR